MDYRRLVAGEIIHEGDEVDGCVDSWRDDPIWQPAGNIGQPAPDPTYPAHSQYRRPIFTRKLWPASGLRGTWIKWV